MVGDRMDTDVVAGVETGLDTVLVLSGCTTSGSGTVPLPAQLYFKRRRRYLSTGIREGGGRMITVLNRREVMATFSLKTQAEARELLSGSGIDYTVHVKTGSHRRPYRRRPAHTGTLGQKNELFV